MKTDTKVLKLVKKAESAFEAEAASTEAKTATADFKGGDVRPTAIARA